MDKYKLYFDDEEVKRGYYVYLHRSKKSGEVFYVGKGSGNRAWETKKRNDRWKQKVEELEGDWEVELYEEDLTEIEAFRIEEKLVEEYGFHNEDNEQLTNRIPGGEMPASFSIGLGFSKSGEDEIYEELRKFKDPSKQRKQEIAIELREKLDVIYEELWELDIQYDYIKERDYDDIEHNPGSVISLSEDAKIASEDFLDSRISWKQFCLDVEYSYEWFQRDCYKDEEVNKRRFGEQVYENFVRTRNIIMWAYQKIGSGNKNEARRRAKKLSNYD